MHSEEQCPATTSGSQSRSSSRLDDMSSSESTYSDTRTRGPYIQCQSTDNLLDYYHSPQAGQSYTHRLHTTPARPLGPRAQGSASSYYTTDGIDNSRLPASTNRFNMDPKTGQSNNRGSHISLPGLPQSNDAQAAKFASPSVPMEEFIQVSSTNPNETKLHDASFIVSTRSDEHALHHNLPITELDSDLVASPKSLSESKLPPTQVDNSHKHHSVSQGISTSPTRASSRTPTHRSTSPADVPSLADHHYVPSLHSIAGPLPPPPRHIKPPTAGLAPPPRPPRPPRLHSPAGRKIYISDSGLSTAAKSVDQRPTSSSSTPSHSEPARIPSPLKTFEDMLSPQLTLPLPKETTNEAEVLNALSCTPPQHKPHSEIPMPVACPDNHVESALQYHSPQHAREGAIASDYKGHSPQDPEESADSAQINAPISTSFPSPAPPRPIRGSPQLPAVPEKQLNAPDVLRLGTQFGDLAEFLPPVWNPDVYSLELGHPNGEGTPYDGMGSFTPASMKKLSLSPPCLQFEEMNLLQSSIERIRAYSRKMQELATYDTGLQDWMAYERERRTLRHKTSFKTMGSDANSTKALFLEQRRVSRGSAASEITFPLRADAYVATDLTSNRNEESTISTEPPSDIPYPSLLHRTGWTPQESPKATSTSSFFTSMARKAGQKKEKSSGVTGLSGITGLTPVTNKLVRSAPVPPQPRPVNLPPAPLAGGPRSRPTRTPSVIGSRAAIHFSTSGDSSGLSRSPSLPASPPKAVVAISPEDLKKQVDRLADVLPHVNRKILEGYLKHSGQDILAIGQYIEDEKHGNIRYEYLE